MPIDHRGRRCEVCQLLIKACACTLPHFLLPFDLKLLIHPRECERPSSTTPLLRRQSSWAVWQRDEAPAFLSDIAPSSAPIYVLYPSDTAVECDLIGTAPSAIILLDGTWKETRRMLARTPKLASYSQVKLKFLPISQFHYRRNQDQAGVSSLEAVIALAAQWLDADAELYNKTLLDRFFKHLQASHDNYSIT